MKSILEMYEAHESLQKILDDEFGVGSVSLSVSLIPGRVLAFTVRHTGDFYARLYAKNQDLCPEDVVYDLARMLNQELIRGSAL